MKYIIRKSEKKDCKDIAHVITVAWNETCKGIVPDEFYKHMGGKLIKTRIFKKLKLPENVYLFEKI